MTEKNLLRYVEPQVRSIVISLLTSTSIYQLDDTQLEFKVKKYVNRFNSVHNQQCDYKEVLKVIKEKQEHYYKEKGKQNGR